MRPYPEYSENESEVLNKIPVNWDIKKLKYIASCNDDTLNENTKPTYSFNYVDIGSVSKVAGIEKVQNLVFSEAPTRARRKAQDGDIALSTVRTYLEAIAPIRGEATNYIFSTGFAIIRPKGVDKDFLRYALTDSSFLYQVMRESTGVSYPAINYSNVMNLSIALPSLIEQHDIVKYLNGETSKIDSLISEKRNFINLIEEKRQALISHVVTKGLDENVKMKDSGVEWIGEVPEHWELKKNKHVFSLITEKADCKGQFTIALENIQSMTGEYIVTESEYAAEGVPFEEFDVLFGKLRPYLEKVYLCKRKGVSFGDILVFRPLREINPNFGYFVMANQALIEIINSSTFGAKMPRARPDFIRDMWLPIPSIKEQMEISDFLNNQITKYSRLAVETKKTIELLKERRSALISAAVTGKIDVREAV